jgi:hypothetical protein
MREYMNKPMTLAAAMLLAWAVRPAGAEVLAAGGHTDYAIVLPNHPAPAESRAATELQTFLEQITGAKLPIVPATADLPAHAIALGAVPGSPATPPTSGGTSGGAGGAGAEGFTIETKGGHLGIAGASPRATMYGVTALLEHLGVRFLTPTVTRVPARRDLDLPDLHEQDAPAYEYREPFFFEAFDKDWAARLRINGNSAHLDDSTGGHVTYGPFVHTMDALVPQDLFKDHPEYFPLINGHRKNGYVQRCLSNPDVLEIAYKGLLHDISANPDATIFSVSQNDTGNWCTCDKCKAIEEKYKSHSGLYVWFVNQLAERVEKDHPKLLIDTIAYQFTEPAPVGIAPRANVRIRLCPIANCVVHPYLTCQDPAVRKFMNNLTNWSALTDDLYIWHYNTDFANYLQPLPDFEELAGDLRMYKSHGVRGVFFEGDYAPGGGGSDAELRSYVLAKLLWDPSLPMTDLVHEWMAGVYGPAERPMRAWFDLLHRNVAAPDRHVHIYDPPSAFYLDAATLAEGERLHDQAEKRAAADPVALRYIAKSRLCLRYVEISQRHEKGPELDTFLHDVRAAGITELREGQPVDEWERSARK